MSGCVNGRDVRLHRGPWLSGSDASLGLCPTTPSTPLLIDVPQGSSTISPIACAGPAPLPDDGWDTGVPVAYSREMVDHRRTVATRPTRSTW